MVLYYDLKVFKDVYQLILKIFEYTKDFPREYKYTLGQDMKRDAIVLVTIRNCFINGEYWETDYGMAKCRTVTIAGISTGKALGSEQGLV